jgi:hypothetical protein
MSIGGAKRCTNRLGHTIRQTSNRGVYGVFVQRETQTQRETYI